MGESLGCGECSVTSIPSALALGLQHKSCYRGGDEQDDENNLQGQHLARDTARLFTLSK
ncbi:hypothetical protein V2J94_45355 [Streptomyces sp. DSM 41524]|uniref:Uncharacterized protein n=1 Tax=Streptomyces asiaticus subsp. ignotus TaxID=3098222 RepID=A0ABU7QC38_9ACTN|nr:hypothetical protein [Streptomyces sp. DSM 41524]